MSLRDEPAALTISQLAAATGMTVRNIRAHQSRGLLPAPVRRGRIAYYGPVHLDRLRAISDLQQRGFNLVAIAAVFDAQNDNEQPVGPGLPPAVTTEIERLVHAHAEDIAAGVVTICQRSGQLVERATPVATAALADRIRERAEAAETDDGVPPAAAM